MPNLGPKAMIILKVTMRRLQKFLISLAPKTSQLCYRKLQCRAGSIYLLFRVNKFINTIKHLFNKYLHKIVYLIREGLNCLELLISAKKECLYQIAFRLIQKLKISEKAKLYLGFFLNKFLFRFSFSFT